MKMLYEKYSLNSLAIFSEFFAHKVITINTNKYILNVRASPVYQLSIIHSKYACKLFQPKKNAIQ